MNLFYLLLFNFFSRQIVDGTTELLMVQLNYFGSLFLFFYVTSSTTH